MIRSQRRLFLQEYIGLANRLESLILAFAIQQAYRHEILLDWPELDALVVQGTSVGAPGLFGRIGALRLRECPSDTFTRLGEFRKILLRTYIGPDEKLDPLETETIKRIGIRRGIAEEIRAIFTPLNQRPVIGIHIRRGDFRLADEDIYDATASRHPAVPLWWYEQTMSALVKRLREPAFYLSCSGEGSAMSALKRNFDIVQARSLNPYGRGGTDHHAELHPVVDLFALACCPIILGTPLSSFTHYAANRLGPPSACLLPPIRMQKGDSAVCQLDGRTQRLPQWTKACRSGEGYQLLSADLREITAAPATIDWLPVAQ